MDIINLTFDLEGDLAILKQLIFFVVAKLVCQSMNLILVLVKTHIIFPGYEGEQGR